MKTGPDQLSTTFQALADPTRRAILARLTDGDASVSELAAPFAMSQPAVSRHLKVLEQAGLISRSRQATFRLSHLEAEPLRTATQWLAGYREYWTESFERLDELLASPSFNRARIARRVGSASAPKTASSCLSAITGSFYNEFVMDCQALGMAGRQGKAQTNSERRLGRERVRAAAGEYAIFHPYGG